MLPSFGCKLLNGSSIPCIFYLTTGTFWYITSYAIDFLCNIVPFVFNEIIIITYKKKSCIWSPYFCIELVISWEGLLMLPSFGCKLLNGCPSFIMSLVAFGFNFKLKGDYVLAANCLMSAIHSHVSGWF
jgi:hypothetical protein